MPFPPASLNLGKPDMIFLRTAEKFPAAILYDQNERVMAYRQMCVIVLRPGTDNHASKPLMVLFELNPRSFGH